MTAEGFKFQASVKDADGDMVNVRADSVEEFAHQLANFPVGDYAQFKANVRGGAALGGVVQPQASEFQQGVQQGWGGAPQAPAEPTWGHRPPAAAPAQQPGVQYHPEGIQCPVDGNVVQFKQITSKKTGKSFQLWTCPNQRSQGDGHYSEFAN